MSRTKLFARPIYWLLILALVLSLALAAPVGSKVSAALGEVWVDDDAPAGWYVDPTHFNKIKGALTAVAQPGTVHVAAGNYTENNINLRNNVHVLGAGADVTTIDGGGSGPVVKASGVGASTKLDGFTITNGTASNGGGMSITNNASPLISNCIFSGNTATWGGGMYNPNSSPTVSNCDFSGNSAAYYGGGMYNYPNSSPTVTNCIFSGNSASSGGGMSNIHGSSPTVTNCIFSGNSAKWGGGMHNDDSSSPTVTNCNFSSNSGSVRGGGIYNNNYSSPTVTNCILWDNGQEIFSYGNSTAVLTYCDIQGEYSGVGNIEADPMFVNPSAHDYHSKPGSPCIDAGTNDGAPGKDKDGDPRPIDGDWDGTATTDMGAYEYIPVLTVEFSATPTTGPIPLEVQFSDETSGNFSSWSWDFGDGGTSSEQNPTHTYNQTGPFTVSLSISSLSGGGAETKVNYIHPYTQGVGGKAYPVSRLAILAPWFGLAALLLGGTGWLVLRRRRAQG